MPVSVQNVEDRGEATVHPARQAPRTLNGLRDIPSFAPLAGPIATSLIFLPYLLASSHTFALEKWHLNGPLSHVPIFGGPAKGKRRPKNLFVNL